MLPPDYSNGLEIWIRLSLIILHCVLFCFTQHHCSYVLKPKFDRFLCALGTLQNEYIFHCTTFPTLYEWYTLWEELRQLQACGQQHTQLKTDDQLIQTSPPYGEYIMEIRPQWIPTPFAEQATVFQDLQQDFQVSNVEFSLDLHVPNVSLERIHTPPVVHNDRALTEFIHGEERCLKFINQDLMFLQESHNISH